MLLRLRTLYMYISDFVSAKHLLGSLNDLYLCGKSRKLTYSHCKFKLNSLSPFQRTGFPLLSNFFETARLCVQEAPWNFYIYNAAARP